MAFYILEVPQLEQAKNLIEKDPLVRAKILDYELEKTAVTMKQKSHSH